MSNDQEQTMTDPNAEPDHIKNLRERASQAGTLEKELAKERAKNALIRAGVDVDSPLGNLLLTGLETNGIDPTDLDSVKAFVESIAPGTSGPAGVGTEPTAAELEAERQRQLLGQGGGIPANTTTPTPHPTDKALKEFHDARQAGAPLEAAQLAAYDKIRVAAANGDQRAIFNRDDWARQQAEAGL